MLNLLRKILGKYRAFKSWYSNIYAHNKMKKIIKSKIKQLILFFIRLLTPMENIIIFESAPDFSCNTYPVFELLRKKLPGYKMIWLVHNEDFRFPVKGSFDILKHEPENYIDVIRLEYFMYHAKALIFCNRILPKKRKNQLSLFLSHGSPGKNVKFYAKEKFGAYVNLQSHFFDDKISSSEPGKLVYLGYPRCDYFYVNNNIDTGEILWNIRGAKYIIWLPTYRRHKSVYDHDNNSDSIFNHIGMPLIYSVEALKKFNDFLSDIDMHILYKPHFAQDVSVIKSSGLSNIHIIYDADFLSKGLQLYEIMAGSQALITDYSSVFFDYLLLDRPIATTIDDLSDYKAYRGFVYDLESFHKKASVRVSNIEDLKLFIMDVKNNKDTKQEGRREIRDITNIHQDGKSAERAASFIMEKINK